MKRTGNLYDAVCDLHNLYLAFYKAARHKRKKAAVLSYQKNLDSNLQKLRQQLVDCDWQVGNYHYFMVYDPKQRNICAAEFQERVLHHAIINVMEKVFDRQQIYDSYACRLGRGTERALLRCKEFAGKYKYAVKLDIRKYFDSVDHAVLMSLLRRKIKDKKMLALLDAIIQSYSTTRGKGIPIGNLTSQYFANYYLSFMDRMIKENLGVLGYLRYMDDFVLFSDSRADLVKKVVLVSCYLEKELKLFIKEPVHCKVSCGVPFLGFVVFPHKIRLGRKSRKRIEDRLVKWEGLYCAGKCSMDDLVRHITPVFGWAGMANTVSYRRQLLKKRDMVY